MIVVVVVEAIVPKYIVVVVVVVVLAIELVVLVAMVDNMLVGFVVYVRNSLSYPSFCLWFWILEKERERENLNLFIFFIVSNKSNFHSYLYPPYEKQNDNANMNTSLKTSILKRWLLFICLFGLFIYSQLIKVNYYIAF